MIRVFADLVVTFPSSCGIVPEVLRDAIKAELELALKHYYAAVKPEVGVTIKAITNNGG